MKNLLLKSIFFAALLIGNACNTNQNEMDEREDAGIRPDRDYERSKGDTSGTDEINATGNAQSGPDDGP